jgi:hypothetical protein
VKLEELTEFIRKLSNVLRLMLITTEDSTVIMRFNQPPYDFYISIKCNNQESCELMKVILKYIEFLRHLPF